MQRFLSSFATAVLLFSVGTPVFAAKSTPAATHTAAAAHGAMSASAMHSLKTTTCPKGQMYVKGYTKKDGKKVAGYCRKSK